MVLIDLSSLLSLCVQQRVGAEGAWWAFWQVAQEDPRLREGKKGAQGGANPGPAWEAGVCRKHMESRAPPLSAGVSRNSPSGCLKPWIAPNPVHIVFSSTCIPMMKFNL